MQHTENNQQNSTAHLKVAKRVYLKSFITQKNSVTRYGDQHHLELLWLSFHNANKYHVAHLKLMLLVSYNSVFKKRESKETQGLINSGWF